VPSQGTAATKLSRAGKLLVATATAEGKVCNTSPQEGKFIVYLKTKILRKNNFKENHN